MRNLAAFFLFAFVATQTLSAQDRAVIERGKAATALVDLSSQEISATAFCIDKSGVFVTNHHVVVEAEEGADVRLILNPASDSQQEVLASVIRVDEKHDLALLRTKEPGDFVALPLGKNSDVFETMQTVVFGFPFGKGLAVEEDSYPAMSVNVGRIAAIRRRGAAEELFQLDAEINPGNSGGAVLDVNGNVIGVVSSGVFATGVSFAIPVDWLTKQLRQPDVKLDLPPITAGNLAEASELRVILTPLLSDLADPVVEATLEIDDAEPVTIPMERGDENVFVGKFVPQEKGTQKRVLLDGHVVFAEGEFTARIVDAEFEIAGKKRRLADVTRITPGDKTDQYDLVFADGNKQTGVLNGLGQVSVDFGDARADLDLSAATEISLSSNDDALQSKFTIVVRDGSQEVYRIATSAGETLERRNNGDTGGVSLKSYSGPKKSVPLPGVITDVVAARGGRMLLLTMKQVKKLAIFDCNSAAIVKVLPLASHNVIVVGTLNHAIVFDRTKDVIERWSLKTFRRELTVTTPFNGVVKSAVAGAASRGPILVLWSGKTDALARVACTTVDVQTLKEKKIAASGRFGGVSYRDAMHLRASANGRVFGMWATSHSPQGLNVGVLLDDKLVGLNEHTSVGHVVPSADGMHLLTGIGGVFSNSLTSKSGGTRTRVPCVPTTHPRLYLTVPAEPGAQRNLGRDPFKGVKPAIHVVDSEAPLLGLPSLDLGDDVENRSWSANDLTLDKRVYYVVSGNMLLSIPFSNDKIVVQGFDLLEELDRSPVDYFFVASVPVRVFEPGKTYGYRINVASKRSGAKFDLTSGPEGMRVSGSGDVSWTVPKDFPDQKVDVIVGITNSANQACYETFTIYRAEE